MNKNDGWWTDDRIALLKELVGLGMSAGQICKRMNATSRSAVCAKIFRLGLARPKRTANKERAMQKRIVARKRDSVVTEAAKRVRKPDDRLTGYVPALTVVEPLYARPWISRSFGECAYPVSGEGADTFSCCLPVHSREDGSLSVYCRGHHERAFVAPKTTTKELIKSVRRAA